MRRFTGLLVALAGVVSTCAMATEPRALLSDVESRNALPPVGTTCAYTLSSLSGTVAYMAGAGSLLVTGSPAGCLGEWDATRTASWLTSLSGRGIGSGSWQVNFGYEANPSTTSRTATITFVAFFGASFPSGSTYSVTQDPAPPVGTPCAYTLTPLSGTVAYTAGAGSVLVTGSPAGCPGTWSVTSATSWLTGVTPTAGSGSGSVQVDFSYGANPSATSRTAAITFAAGAGASFPSGSTYSVTQDPAGSCTEDALTLCLIGGRYRVTTHWRNQYAGGALSNLNKTRLTSATGAFWLFDSSSIEYLIRVNTATDNGRAWIAIPTFTDVEFWVLVQDTVNGQAQTYHSAAGNRTLIYDPYFFVYP